jgi:hypothetical protein
MAVKTIGLLSPGDMGSVVAKVVQSYGLRVITYLKGRSERTCMLAQEARIETAIATELLITAQTMGLYEPLVAEQNGRSARRTATAPSSGSCR